MRKALALLLASSMALSLTACGGGSASTAAPAASTPAAGSTGASDDGADDFYIDLKFSNVFQPTEWNYKASEKFAQMVNERTEGHINITYYGQNELDCYGDSVTQAVNGSNWIGLEQPDLFADYVGDCAVLVGPMLYSTDDEYNYLMDSEPVQDIKARLAEDNIHILDTHYSFGFRSLVTNRDITEPSDLAGVKLRATSSALYTKTLEAMGAIATPMSFTECLSAISAGVVEGFEGSTSTLAGAGAPYVLVKKVALTNHLIATRWLFMGEDVYQSIPQKYRDILDEAAVECGEWEQTSCAEDEDAQKAMLAEHGVTWNDVDLDAFTEACAPVYDWIVEEYDGVNPDLHQELVKLIQDYRANNA